MIRGGSIDVTKARHPQACRTTSRIPSDFSAAACSLCHAIRKRETCAHASSSLAERSAPTDVIRSDCGCISGRFFQNASPDSGRRGALSPSPDPFCADLLEREGRADSRRRRISVFVHARGGQAHPYLGSKRSRWLQLALPAPAEMRASVAARLSSERLDHVAHRRQYQASIGGEALSNDKAASVRALRISRPTISTIRGRTKRREPTRLN
jgi:hypothetical protein